MKNKKFNIGDVVVVQMDVTSFGEPSSHIGLVIEAPNKEARHVKVMCPGDNNKFVFEPSEVTLISKHRGR